MTRIKRFKELILESVTGQNFQLDERFPWTEKIEELIDEILFLSEGLKDDYHYGKRDTPGFEFDVKMKKWPEGSDFGVSDELINDLWWTFLQDNLKMAGDDIIETSEELFDDWFQTGRSGGWLLLQHDSRVINEPEDLIRDIVDDVNTYTEDISDEDVELWKKLRSSKGNRILQRLGQDQEFEDIEEAELYVKDAIENLEYELNYLKKLKEKLEAVDSRIDRFWENSLKYFKEYAEEELGFIED